jgi:hypothetical protein
MSHLGTREIAIIAAIIVAELAEAMIVALAIGGRSAVE